MEKKTRPNNTLSVCTEPEQIESERFEIRSLKMLTEVRTILTAMEMLWICRAAVARTRIHESKTGIGDSTTCFTDTGIISVSTLDSYMPATSVTGIGSGGASPLCPTTDTRPGVNLQLWSRLNQ